MNDKDKKQRKLEKWARQIGYTAFKLIRLCGKDTAQIKGNGLIITIKKWGNPADEHEYWGDNEQDETKKEIEEKLDALACKKTLEEKVLNREKEKTHATNIFGERILDDKSFEEEIAKIREGWKK